MVLRQFHQLAVLSEFSNRDKHRHPHLAIIGVTGLEIRTPVDATVKHYWVSQEARADNGAMLARVEFVEPLKPGMRLEFYPTGLVGLDYVWQEGTRRTAIDKNVTTPLDSTLKGVLLRVRRVVAVLAPHL